MNRLSNLLYGCQPNYNTNGHGHEVVIKREEERDHGVTCKAMQIKGWAPGSHVTGLNNIEITLHNKKQLHA